MPDQRRDHERKARHDARRPSARERGYTSKWEQARLEFLRQHPKCAHPGCTEPSSVVDHITPHKGDAQAVLAAKQLAGPVRPPSQQHQAIKGPPQCVRPRNTHTTARPRPHAWAEEIGITYCTLWQRINSGMSIEDALSRGRYHRSANSFGTSTMLDFDGVSQPVSEWALDYGITSKVICARLRNGWTIERAITEPMRVTKARDCQRHRGWFATFPEGAGDRRGEENARSSENRVFAAEQEPSPCQ